MCILWEHVCISLHLHHGKKWVSWPISSWPGPGRGTCVFHSEGVTKQRHHFFFFSLSKCGFPLGKNGDLPQGAKGEKQQKNKKETGRKERIIEKRIAGEDRHQEVGGRGEAGRDLDRGEGIYCHTCEHLPTHILQVSEQPETSSKGWLWETGGKQDSQELWERTWSETHDVIFKSLHQRGRYKYRAAGSLRSCERRKNTQMEKDTFMSSSPSVKWVFLFFF